MCVLFMYSLFCSLGKKVKILRIRSKFWEKGCSCYVVWMEAYQG